MGKQYKWYNSSDRIGESRSYNETHKSGRGDLGRRVELGFKHYRYFPHIEANIDFCKFTQEFSHAIISPNEFIDINRALDQYNIRYGRDYVIEIIVFLNSLLEARNTIPTQEISLFKHISSQQKPIENALKEYLKCVQNFSNNTNIASITFKFNRTGMVYKIDSEPTLSDIMNTLLREYTGIESVDFLKGIMNRIASFTHWLNTMLTDTNLVFYSQNRSKVYRFIQQLFQLAGFSYSSDDSIRKYIEKGNNTL